MMSNERTALVKLKNKLERFLPLVDFRVFGSKSRGDDGPASDIDVMIEVENYTPEVESLIDEWVFEINIECDCLISALIFSSNELKQSPLRESPIYKAICNEGVGI